MSWAYAKLDRHEARRDLLARAAADDANALECLTAREAYCDGIGDAERQLETAHRVLELFPYEHDAGPERLALRHARAGSHRRASMASTSAWSVPS